MVQAIVGSCLFIAKAFLLANTAMNKKLTLKLIARNLLATIKVIFDYYLFELNKANRSVLSEST